MSLLLVLQGAPPSQSMSFGSAASGATGSPGLFSFVAVFGMTWGAAAGGATTDPGTFAFVASYRQTYPTMSNAYTFNPGSDFGYVTVADYIMIFGALSPNDLTYQDPYRSGPLGMTGGTDGILLANGSAQTMTF